MSRTNMVGCCVSTAIALTLLLAGGCGGEPQESAGEPANPAQKLSDEEATADYFETMKAVKNEEDEGKQFEILVDYLDRNPDGFFTASMLDHVVKSHFIKRMDDLAGGIAFVEERLTRMTGPRRNMGMEQLVGLYGRAGNVDKLRKIAVEAKAREELDFGLHLALADAATTVEAWEMAIEHAREAADGATLEAVRAFSEGLGASDSEENLARIVNATKCNALTTLGDAQMKVGDIDSALASYGEAESHDIVNYLGQPLYSSDLNVHWAGALIAKGDYEAAMRRIAPDAILQGDEGAMEVFKEAYAKSGGDQANLESAIERVSAAIARPMPEFEVHDYEGNKKSWSELKGRVTLVSFWFPTCGPCRTELPHLEALYRKYRDRGFQIVVIDGLRQTEEAHTFFEENGDNYSFTFLEDGEGEENVANNIFRIASYPTNFLVDEDGKIRYFHGGYQYGDEVELEKQIVSLLDE